MSTSRGINRPRHKWTTQQEQQLRCDYPNLPASVLAQRFGVSKDVIYRKANALGLAKSKEFQASDLSGRILRGRNDPRMKSTQFKPGFAPWNKGTNFSPGGRSAQTRFAKGSKPVTTMPVGAYRITQDKRSGRRYLEIKLNELPGPNTVRWKPVHRLVWEKEVGPIPEGYLVVFKPGMSSVILEEITVDRLECINRAENARRNVPTAKHPEVAKLIQLKGAITRQVNRISKEHKAAR